MPAFLKSNDGNTSGRPQHESVANARQRAHSGKERKILTSAQFVYFIQDDFACVHMHVCGICVLHGGACSVPSISWCIRSNSALGSLPRLLVMSTADVKDSSWHSAQ